MSLRMDASLRNSAAFAFFVLTLEQVGCTHPLAMDRWKFKNSLAFTHSARTSDKATGLRVAAKYEAQAALRPDGVSDPKLDHVRRESRRDIESHLVDFEAKLQVGARTANLIRRTIKFILGISEKNRWVRAEEITAEGFIDMRPDS